MQQMDHAAVHFTWLSVAVWIPPSCYIYAELEILVTVLWPSASIH